MSCLRLKCIEHCLSLFTLLYMTLWEHLSVIKCVFLGIKQICTICQLNFDSKTIYNYYTMQWANATIVLKFSVVNYTTNATKCSISLLTGHFSWMFLQYSSCPVFSPPASSGAFKCCRTYKGKLSEWHNNFLLQSGGLYSYDFHRVYNTFKGWIVC